MIDKPHELPIVRQFKILELERATAYYMEEAQEAMDKYGKPEIALRPALSK